MDIDSRDSSLSPGTTVVNYTVREVLSASEFYDVYRAHNLDGKVCVVLLVGARGAFAMDLPNSGSATSLTADQLVFHNAGICTKTR